MAYTFTRIVATAAGGLGRDTEAARRGNSATRCSIADPADTMFAVRQRIVGLGALMEFTDYSRLVWERCGHMLLVPKVADAGRWIRRHYPSCLECQHVNPADDWLPCKA